MLDVNFNDYILLLKILSLFAQNLFNHVHVCVHEEKEKKNSFNKPHSMKCSLCLVVLKLKIIDLLKCSLQLQSAICNFWVF